MAKDNKFFEDLAKLAGSAMGTAFEAAHDFRENFEHALKAKTEECLKKMNVVQREEFEVVKEMAQKALLKQQELEKELMKLKKGQKTKPKTVRKIKTKKTIK